jgi:hypothetical protein
VEYRFDLIAQRGHFAFTQGGWQKVRVLLLEMQPARTVTLLGELPSTIRVVALGEPAEVAPAVLARIEALAGTTLTIKLLD